MNYTYLLFWLLAVLVTGQIERIIPNRPGIGLVTLPSMFLGMAAGLAYSDEVWYATFWAAAGIIPILYYRYKSLHSGQS